MKKNQEYRLLLLYAYLEGWKKLSGIFLRSKKLCDEKRLEREYYSFDPNFGRMFWAMKHYYVASVGVAPAYIVHWIGVELSDMIVEITVYVRGEPQKSWGVIKRHTIAVVEPKVMRG